MSDPEKIPYFFLRGSQSSQFKKPKLGGAGSHKQEKYIVLSISNWSKNNKGDKSVVLLRRTSCQCQISYIDEQKFFTKCSSS